MPVQGSVLAASLAVAAHLVNDPHALAGCRCGARDLAAPAATPSPAAAARARRRLALARARAPAGPEAAGGAATGVAAVEWSGAVAPGAVRWEVRSWAAQGALEMGLTASALLRLETG